MYGVPRTPWNEAARKYVLAYRGTEVLSAGDWWTNFKQGTSLTAAQYDFGIETAKKWQGLLGSNLELVGHSLGGGLATAASLVTGLKATVFNPAGVAAATLNLHGVKLEDVANVNNVTAYCVQGEALTSVQDSKILGLLMPNTVGQVVRLYASRWYDPIAKNWKSASAFVGVRKHVMNSVLRGLGYEAE